MENYLKSKKDEKKNTGVVCPYCPCNSPNFTSYQYLNHHITYKHPHEEQVKKTEREATLCTLNDLSAENAWNGIPTENSKGGTSETGQPNQTATTHAKEAKDSNSQGQNKKTRGSSRRRSYILYFKMKVLKELKVAERDKTIKNKYAFIAEKFNISRSMVCRWKKQHDESKKEAEKLKTKKSRTGVDSSRTT